MKFNDFRDFGLEVRFFSKNPENQHFCEFLRFRGPKVLKYHWFYKQTGQGDARFALFAHKCTFTQKVDFPVKSAILA